MSEETEITVEEAPAEAETSPTEQAAAEPGAEKTEKSGTSEVTGTAPASLSEQLGGDEAIQNAVDILTDRLMSDPRVNYFLFGVSRAHQGEKHKSFLTIALKGAEGDEAVDLRRQFDHFFDRGLRDRHFDLILAHLRDTFRQMEIGDELADAAVRASNDLRRLLFSR